MTLIMQSAEETSFYTKYEEPALGGHEAGGEETGRGGRELPLFNTNYK